MKPKRRRRFALPAQSIFRGRATGGRTADEAPEGNTRKWSGFGYEPISSLASSGGSMKLKRRRRFALPAQSILRGGATGGRTADERTRRKRKWSGFGYEPSSSLASSD